jgi:hypothetical protein
MNDPFPQLARRISKLIQSFRSGHSRPDPKGFEALAADIFAAQFEHNPAYQTWCKARGVTPDQHPASHQFPAVPTALFKETLFTSIPPEKRIAEFRSSGTTSQQPSRHVHSTDSLALYRESALAHFEQHFLPDLEELVETGLHEPEDKPTFISLTPSPGVAPHSSLARMLGDIFSAHGHPDSVFVGRIGRDAGWEIDFPRLDEAFIHAQCTLRPVFLLGTAFNVVHLIDRLVDEDRVHHLMEGSRLMETGGYKGRSRELSRPDLHGEAHLFLGLAPSGIVTEYGMSELSSQGYDRVAKPLSKGQYVPPIFTFPPWARATVVSPETGLEVADGERGLLRVVDLANLWSVSAIQTADEAIRRGNRFEWIGRATQSEPRGCSRMSL